MGNLLGLGEDSKKVIFVLGGPGSGKGIHCQKIVALEKYHGFAHLSTGDLLRAEVNSKSERGKKIKDIMEKGDLVALEIVFDLLKEAMQKKPDEIVFLLDGFPRELEQGKKFEEEKIGEVQFVLYFEIPDATMKKRLMKRAETSGRVDDNEETIKKRIKTFHDLTEPVISHYGAQDKVCKVETKGLIDEVSLRVQAILDEKIEQWNKTNPGSTSDCRQESSSK